MSFFESGLVNLGLSAVTKNVPAYVQYFLTARCNLACRQCNVIHSNADVAECGPLESRRIIENLAAVGTSVVLLTGGEPFVRKDIVDLYAAVLENGMHPRLQTNGLATREQLAELAGLGAHDISVSLDTVVPRLQDELNGGRDDSWTRAIETIADINATFPEDSFCALGTVLSPHNIDHVRGVIRLATAIGWWVSLVPAHSASPLQPRSFCSPDVGMEFSPADARRVERVLDDVKALRAEGMNVYDSDEYLDDIGRYVAGRPVRWRRRNRGQCDSPNLYFAVLPNGDMAPCCDWRLPESYPVHSPEFPRWYRSELLRGQARAIRAACPGCMYGSYPEVSITMRYFTPMLRRAGLFLAPGSRGRLQRLSAGRIVEIARDIANEEGLLEDGGGGS